MPLPLILLPGMMCDARLFAPQIDALSPDRPVTVGTLTGHDSVTALAHALLADAPPRFALAGLSMGGIVAMEMARLAPGRVARLALMDTNPLAETPEKQALRAQQIAAVRDGGLETVMRDEMKPNYLTDGPARAQILDLCMQMALDLGADAFVSQSLALRDRPDQQDTLRGYTGHALVLCGRHDVLCPPERHALMHRLLPNGVLEIIETAGHLPTLEAPGMTTAAMVRWLQA